jgi:hypothetical protein
MYSKAFTGSPPWHPLSFNSQEIKTYGAIFISGQAAFLIILILSERAEVAA